MSLPAESMSLGSSCLARQRSARQAEATPGRTSRRVASARPDEKGVPWFWKILYSAIGHAYYTPITIFTAHMSPCRFEMVGILCQIFFINRLILCCCYRATGQYPAHRENSVVSLVWVSKMEEMLGKMFPFDDVIMAGDDSAMPVFS